MKEARYKDVSKSWRSGHTAWEPPHSLHALGQKLTWKQIKFRKMDSLKRTPLAPRSASSLFMAWNSSWEFNLYTWNYFNLQSLAPECAEFCQHLPIGGFHRWNVFVHYLFSSSKNFSYSSASLSTWTSTWSGFIGFAPRLPPRPAQCDTFQFCFHIMLHTLGNYFFWARTFNQF
jgi:hypothetical protein